MGTERTPAGAPCPVCGGARVRSDAVEAADGAGLLLLGECARCEHRWTAPAPRPAPLRAEGAVRAGREAARANAA